MGRIAKARGGFTLVELLAVIVIIGILAAGIFMLVRTASSRAATAKTTAQVHAIASLLEEYKNIYGNYPVVSNADDDGYASLNFTFKASDGGSCSQCGNKPSNDNVAFGLCSHFVPRAETIYGATHGGNMEDHYDDCFADPSGQDNEVWEKEFGKRSHGDLTDARESEVADTNLQQIYRAWKRLQADNLVKAGVTVCPYCSTQTYSAGAESDAWGNSLKYHVTGGAGEIVSAGPDGSFGTGDDITSGGAAVTDED